ncbi:MAG: hypothetical protein ACI9P8_001209, partial [Bacteroidia bacterium]
RSIDEANTWAYEENISLINHFKAIDTGRSIPKWIVRRMYTNGYYKLAKCHHIKGDKFPALANLIKSIIAWPAFQYKFKFIFLLNILGLSVLLPIHVRDEF